MFIYLDNGDLIFIEQLTLELALPLRARTEAWLPCAYNTAHAAFLLQQLSLLQEQIEWLQTKAVTEAQADFLDQMNQDRINDYRLGL